MGKKPTNKKDWNENNQGFQVLVGFFYKKMFESVRMGVLAGLNDAFGGKK